MSGATGWRCAARLRRRLRRRRLRGARRCRRPALPTRSRGRRGAERALASARARGAGRRHDPALPPVLRRAAGDRAPRPWSPTPRPAPELVDDTTVSGLGDPGPVDDLAADGDRDGRGCRGRRSPPRAGAAPSSASTRAAVGRLGRSSIPSSEPLADFSVYVDAADGEAGRSRPAPPRDRRGVGVPPERRRHEGRQVRPLRQQGQGLGPADEPARAGCAAERSRAPRAASSAPTSTPPRRARRRSRSARRTPTSPPSRGPPTSSRR